MYDQENHILGYNFLNGYWLPGTPVNFQRREEEKRKKQKRKKKKKNKTKQSKNKNKQTQQQQQQQINNLECCTFMVQNVLRKKYNFVIYQFIKGTGGQPVLMHGAVTQECDSLLPGNTVWF